MMTFRIIRTPAAFVFGTVLLSMSGMTQTPAPQSPYGGTTVEQIIARINDQIITSSDYQRAEQELNQEEQQRGATMQEASDARRDLLRNLIDQQLWLSKGKELGITGETELIQRLDEIRKQYHLNSLEDLEKAARDQGVSFEDFKQNIRNGIITQDVMRQEVGNKIQITPGEVERYYEAHKQDYAEPESVNLSEILISTGDGDPAKVAAAEAKANEVEAKLHAGGNFSELARAFSNGPTASSGGDLGQYRRGALAKVLEDKVFPLKVGQYTDPIRTKQGYVILEVTAHNPGGTQPFKSVQQDVEQAYFMSQMEPAIRAYLTKMRDEAYIEIKPGYVDTGASPNERVFPISYSAYRPPTTKKKHHVERTRFRETGRGSSDLVTQQTTPQKAEVAAKKSKHKRSQTQEAAMKPGKKEKIRFGQAPQETLPNAAEGETVDAGAVTQAASDVPANPLEAAPVEKKTRFSDRARVKKTEEKRTKQGKSARQQAEDRMTPEAPTPSEVADRQVQSTPLGLGGHQVSTKKKEATTTGEKTRFSDRNRKSEEKKPEAAAPNGTQSDAAPDAPSSAPAQK